MRLRSGGQLGAGIQGLDCGWRICFQIATLMWLVSLAGYWQGASVLHHVACLRILLTWRLMSLRVSDPREKTQCLFLDLASEVTLCHFCPILLAIQMSLIHCGRRLPKPVMTREARIIRSYLRVWLPHSPFCAVG